MCTSSIRLRPIFLLGMGLGVASAVWAEPASDPDLPALESRVAVWVDLRTEIADAQRAWKETRPQLDRERALLQAERDQRRQASDQAAQLEADAAAVQAEQEQRRDLLRAAIDDLDPGLSRAERALRDWPRRLPPGLREPLLPAFAEIAASDRAPESPGARLQRVLGLYTEIERLQGEIHCVTEVVEVPGSGAREIDVLYLGLARGYAATPDGSWAGIAQPGPAGWYWDSRPGLAPAIVEAIAVARRGRSVRLVSLPVQVTEMAP
jgi:hypothetical protein